MDLDIPIYRAEYKCSECSHEEKKVHRYQEDIKQYLFCPVGCRDSDSYPDRAIMNCKIRKYSVFELLSKLLESD